MCPTMKNMNHLSLDCTSDYDFSAQKREIIVRSTLLSKTSPSSLSLTFYYEFINLLSSPILCVLLLCVEIDNVNGTSTLLLCFNWKVFFHLCSFTVLFEIILALYSAICFSCVKFFHYFAGRVLELNTCIS